jgi:ribosomal protein S18 acetylase RimI-like enzyme
MSDTLVLRMARLSDQPVLVNLILTAFAEYRGKLDPESGALRETLESVRNEMLTGSSAIIAERNGMAVGCVMIQEMEGDLYFGRLAVLPEARGLGLARRLIAAVEAEARRRGMPGVRLGVRVVLTENQRLFGALGYVETSREPHPGFDYPTSINMRKALE